MGLSAPSPEVGPAVSLDVRRTRDPPRTGNRGPGRRARGVVGALVSGARRLRVAGGLPVAQHGEHVAAAGGANVLVDLYFVLTGQYFGFDCANDRFTFFRFLT